jgi:2-oxo-4-hydroxy-4-carboxy-5-ureidoimidazoline decarboxylase
MSAASVTEQASAGLDRLTEEELGRFERSNTAYRERFGFPFIIAVRQHDKASILAAYQRRLPNTREVEMATALDEVFAIARVRLQATVQ